MTTKRQKQAVKFTEVELHIKFKGDINNKFDVNSFLSAFLDVAKERHDEKESLYYEALEGYDCNKYF